jgi:hypothetical protein
MVLRVSVLLGEEGEFVVADDQIRQTADSVAA